MKKNERNQLRYLFSFFTLIVVLTSCQDSGKSNISLLSDQKPADTPLIFSKGFISMDSLNEASITFSPEMKELFYARRKPGNSHNIYTMKLIDGKWTAPEVAFFSKEVKYLDFHPRFSHKGDRLYFGSTRPLPDSTKSSGLHEWFIEKDENGWGQPIPMQNPFVDRFIMCMTPAANGNLYFNSKEKGEKLEDEGIYYAVSQKGKYASVKKLGDEINAPGKWIAHPYIAPDESFIIYDAERTSIYENGDLYISFNINGKWTDSYNLGPKINTNINESGATVSPDGKYLFFSRGEELKREDGSKYWLGDIYWVDFIQLKEEILKDMKDS